jgi:hypothetical protein
MTSRVWNGVAGALLALTAVVSAQRAGAFTESRDHAAIRYTSGPESNAASRLIAALARGDVKLTFNPENGYLRSLLDALSLPIESQVVVYSQTSFQAPRISRQNPRAVYFTDEVAVGWVRGGDILEIAAQDERQGVMFYQLKQNAESVEITRNEKCLSCHLSWETLGVPGAMVLSVQPRRSEDEYANGGHVDHGTPLADRWGGWYVTGAQVPQAHLGNLELLQPDMPASGPTPVGARRSLDNSFDLRGFPTPYSDVVALMVLEHQAHAMNLITRAGWEYRVAGGITPRVQEAVSTLVDYFLFIDETPLPGPVRGSSGFAEKFAARGPRDRQGRSLYELQLTNRLLRFPCSFMIYSPGFAGLPQPVRDAVFKRIDDVLAGRDAREKYRHLSAPDRSAIADILRETIPNQR